DDVEIDFDISDKGEVVDGQGRSGKLSIHGNDGEKIVLSNMTFDADLEDKDGVWFGDSTVNFADFSFEDARGMSFGMKNLNLQGGNHGDAKSMKSAAQFTIGEFNVADMTFEDFTFDYSIDNLDTQAVSALQAVSKQGPQVDPTAALEHLKKIVEMSPSININELSVQTPQGKVQADLHVNLPDNVNMVFFPLSLLPQVQADSNIRIPKDVIPMLDALRPGTAQQTEMLVQGGLIKLDGNDYVSVIKMDKGEITVNGVVMPLPF
ncbi:MAG: DUF945 family protein, partial [Gammaproteobacteria bacterium]|nr:DUF945 family protein [Gammaproteobacteria bacterium]